MSQTLAQYLLTRYLAMERPAARDKEIRSKIKQDRCINPECRSGKKPKARGLCDPCYQQARLAIAEAGDEEARIAKERRLIEQGLILAPKEMGRIRKANRNIFARAAS